VADRFEHPAYLPIPSFPDCDQHHAVAIATSLVHQHHVGEFRTTPIEGNAAAQSIERIFIGQTRHAGLVRAIDFMARMRQRCGEVAIVGQQEQTLGVVIEPADRIDVLLHAPQQLDHCAPALRIRSGRDIAHRLV